jgi:hypothetical protein
VCAVSALHNESSEVPYYWFGFHTTQLEFLRSAEVPYICFGCSSSDTTLLVPLATLLGYLDQMSMSALRYWHVVIQRKLNKFVVRLLDGKDGPDLTGFNVGKPAESAASA